MEKLFIQLYDDSLNKSLKQLASWATGVDKLFVVTWTLCIELSKLPQFHSNKDDDDDDSTSHMYRSLRCPLISSILLQ